MRFQNVIKIAIFLVINVLMLNLLSEIFIDKNLTSSVRYEVKHLGFNHFYEEREDSLDVVFLGSSHVYSGISPMEMWNLHGISGYDCTSSSQDAIKSYYFLEEIFKYQSPKVVVFDLMSLFIGKTNDEISNRSAFNCLRFSPVFVKMAWESMNKDNNESLLFLTFPVFRYHSRWEELKKIDFESRATRDLAKGYDMSYGTVQAVKLTQENFPLLTGDKQTSEVQPIEEESATYIRKMVNLCSKEGVKMLFIKTPVTGYTHKMGNAMQNFADECDVPLIDYNLKWQELGIDYTTDFLDTVHLNLNGAQKLSVALGQTLKNTYNIGGHKEDPMYADWNSDYLKYEASIAALELSGCSNVTAWIEKTKNNRYVIMYSGDSAKISNDMLSWLQIENLDQTGICYGILDNTNGSKVFYPGKGKTLYRIEDFWCEVSSLGSYKIRLKSENMINKEEGFCMVVYDKELQAVVDVVTILNGQINRNI